MFQIIWLYPLSLYMLYVNNITIKLENSYEILAMTVDTYTEVTM